LKFSGRLACSSLGASAGPYDHWSTTLSCFQPQVLQNTTEIAKNQQKAAGLFG
jgi:hypothetical protein